MLKLELKKEPYWIDLIQNVRIQVAPGTRPLMMKARAEFLKQDLPEAQEDKDFLFLTCLAQQAILAWEGVGDAEGKPVEPTAAYIVAFLDNWSVARAFEEKYFLPILTLDAEKNG